MTICKEFRRHPLGQEIRGCLTSKNEEVLACCAPHYGIVKFDDAFSMGSRTTSPIASLMQYSFVRRAYLFPSPECELYDKSLKMLDGCDGNLFARVPIRVS
jgi:hypothetical protein